MLLRIPKYIVVLCTVLVQLLNVLLDWQFHGVTHSISAYAIPVIAVAMFLRYTESLLFTVGTSILYIIAGYHNAGYNDGISFALPEAMDLVFLFVVTMLISKLMDEHRNVSQMAINDPLTGLFNHAFLFKQIEKELDRAHRYGRAMSLVMVDIDNFKQYNDTFGHQQGDVVLREAAYILRSHVRSTDIVGRYGGEEFGVVLPETNLGQARVVGERLRTGVGEHSAKSKGIQGTIHISAGIATCTPGTRTAEALVEQADQALYEAKHRGRNQVVLYTPGMVEGAEEIAKQQREESGPSLTPASPTTG